MLFPVVAGSGLLWYLNKVPNRKDVVRLNDELRTKGFGFDLNCKKFIIINTQKAYQWAYQLGEFYKPEFGSIDDHFHKAIDPNQICTKFFKQDYVKQCRLMPKNDLYFYLELVRNYYKGLIKAGITKDLLDLRYKDMVKSGVMYLNLNPTWIGKLSPTL